MTVINFIGMAMLDDEDQKHSCIAELRTALELLRSEMICKLEDQKNEYELRLDAQRTHMVQKEGQMRTEIDGLTAQVRNTTEYSLDNCRMQQLAIMSLE